MKEVKYEISLIMAELNIKLISCVFSVHVNEYTLCYFILAASLYSFLRTLHMSSFFHNSILYTHTRSRCEIAIYYALSSYIHITNNKGDVYRIRISISSSKEPSRGILKD